MLNRKLRFGIEVLDQDYDAADVLETVEQKIPEHNINELLFWGANTVINESIVPPGAQVASQRSPILRGR